MGTFSEQPKPIKFLLVANGLCILLAIVLLALAGKGISGNAEKFTVPGYVIPVVMVVGIFLFMIGFIGLKGVLGAKENKRNVFLMVYTGGSLIFCIMLIVGVAGLASAKNMINTDKNEKAEKLANSTEAALKKLPELAIANIYTYASKAPKDWKQFQTDNKCCGFYPAWAAVVNKESDLAADLKAHNQWIMTGPACDNATATVASKCLEGTLKADNAQCKPMDLADTSGLAASDKTVYCRDYILDTAEKNIAPLFLLGVIMMICQFGALFSSLYIVLGCYDPEADNKV